MNGWVDRQGKKIGKIVRGEEEKGSKIKEKARKEEQKTRKRRKSY
jgi:hypothetical protein